MKWEFKFLRFLQRFRNPILDKIMMIITKLGNAGIFWLIIAGFFLIFEKYRICGISIIISMLIAVIFGNIILKNLFKRNRPCWIDKSIKLLIRNPLDYSFPSGHTYSSITSAFVIFFHNETIGIITLVIAFLIAFSRMYLFVHFPTDVLTSCFLGIVTSLITLFMIEKIFVIYII